MAPLNHSTLTVLARLARRRPPQKQRLLEALENRLTGLAEPAFRVAVELGDPMGPILDQILRKSTSEEDIEVVQGLSDDPLYSQSRPLAEGRRP